MKIKVELTGRMTGEETQCAHCHACCQRAAASDRAGLEPSAFASTLGLVTTTRRSCGLEPSLEPQRLHLYNGALACLSLSLAGEETRLWVFRHWKKCPHRGLSRGPRHCPPQRGLSFSFGGTGFSQTLPHLCPALGLPDATAPCYACCLAGPLGF